MTILLVILGAAALFVVIGLICAALVTAASIMSGRSQAEDTAAGGYWNAADRF